MNKKTFLFPFFSILMVVSMLLMNIQPVSAQETTEVNLTGSVVSVDETAGSFVIEAEDGQLFTIFTPEGFDLTSLSVSLVVEVTGTLNQDGTVAAVGIAVKVQLTGSVLSLSPLANTFEVETEAGQVYTVHTPEGFDWTGIIAGDPVEVAGTLNEDGTVAAASVAIHEGEDGSEDGKETNDGNFCIQSEVPHPFGALLAERYQVDYATLQSWFCKGYGWGQIMLALQTSKINGGNPSAMLAARSGGAGWGQIWREFGLIGKSKDGNSPKDMDGDGRPDNQQNNGKGPDKSDQDTDVNGNGKPDHHKNPNDLDGDGLPDQARPHKPNKHNR